MYNHEIPGGQYSNLRPQAIALGLEHKFEEVKENYAVVNRMFGDIVKVTPSSKVVGDMAIYMTSNGLSEADVMERGTTLAFPDSVIDLFKGGLGQVPGGFPKPLSDIILKGEQPYPGRPNDHIKPVDLDVEFAAFQQEFDPEQTFLDFLSFKMYPAVFRDFYKHQQEYGNLSHLPTPAFFYGLKLNEEVLVELGKGKVLIIKLLYRSPADENGMCTVTFDFNGQIRTVQIRDLAVKPTRATNRKAVGDKEIGTSLQGKLSAIMAKAGDEVEQNTPLFVIEAMKMETTITAPVAGKIRAIHLHAGELVEQGDLVVEME